MLEFGFCETELTLAEYQPPQQPTWFELEADARHQEASRASLTPARRAALINARSFVARGRSLR